MSICLDGYPCTGVDLEVGSQYSTYRTDSEANRDGGDTPCRLAAASADLTVHDAPSGAFFFVYGRLDHFLLFSGNDSNLLILCIVCQGVT